MFRNHLGIATLFGCLALAGSMARAETVSLADGNTTISIDVDGTAHPQGVTNWTVDGRSYMFEQWFYYRVGPNDGERPITSLARTGMVVSNTNFDPGNDVLHVQYSQLATTGAPNFSIDVTFLLTGGNIGSNVSDLAETISIHNNGQTPLEMHFFQYVDLDLSGWGNPQYDYGVFTNSNTVRQWTVGGLVSNETVVTPAAMHRQIGTWPSIISSLDDSLPTTLADTPVGTVVSGDVTWAFQWDVTIAPGGTFQISKDKNLANPVPLPASLWSGLILLGAIGVRSIRRRMAA